MIVPVIPVPTTSVDADIPNDSTFEEAKTFTEPLTLVRELGEYDIDSFVGKYDKTSLSLKESKDLVDSAIADIEWVKNKLAFKLRKPMWQDEKDPRSKEKLIRMFNNYVQKRLNLIEFLGGKY